MSSDSTLFFMVTFVLVVLGSYIHVDSQVSECVNMTTIF